MPNQHTSHPSAFWADIRALAFALFLIAVGVFVLLGVVGLLVIGVRALF